MLQWTKTAIVHQPGRGGKEGKKHTQKNKETDSLKCNLVVQALGEASGAAALWLSFLLPLIETTGNERRLQEHRGRRMGFKVGILSKGSSRWRRGFRLYVLAGRNVCTATGSVCSTLEGQM